MFCSLMVGEGLERLVLHGGPSQFVSGDGVEKRGKDGKFSGSTESILAPIKRRQSRARSSADQGLAWPAVR